MSICPCCGQSVEFNGLMVDLNTNRVVFNGKTVIVSPKLAVLLHVLLEAYPKTVSYDAIAFGMWGNREPDQSLGNIRVYASHARKLLAEFEASVETISGRGFRLVMPHQPPAIVTQRRSRA